MLNLINSTALLPSWAVDNGMLGERTCINIKNHAYGKNSMCLNYFRFLTLKAIRSTILTIDRFVLYSDHISDTHIFLRSYSVWCMNFMTLSILSHGCTCTLLEWISTRQPSSHLSIRWIPIPEEVIDQSSETPTHPPPPVEHIPPLEVSDSPSEISAHLHSLRTLTLPHGVINQPSETSTHPSRR